MTSASGSTSIHCWSMPSPPGPSRRSVGGTMPQPIASDTRYAATSRRVSVPIGKSNSGRSPRVGFQTASSSSGPSSMVAVSPSPSPSRSSEVTTTGTSDPDGRTRTTIALLEDPTSQPIGSISPSRRRPMTAAGEPCAASWAFTASEATATSSVDVGAVLPRADVAGRIERVAAQRARRAPGPDDPERALDEGSRRIGGQADTHEVGAFLIVIVLLDEHLGLGLLVVGSRGAGLDQDPLRVAVPAEGQGRGAEGLVQGLVERVLVGLDGRRRVLDDAPAVELHEEPAEAFGEDGDLGLLERDADNSGAVAGLEEEGSMTGLTDRAGRESVRKVEDEEAAWHGMTLAGFG